MALLAISDLHIGYSDNRAGLARMQARPDDWLLVVGDVGETVAHLEQALDALSPKFARVLWTPGNHELWTRRAEAPLRGEAKYQALLAACRKRGVLTPEDPYPLYRGRFVTLQVAPVFTLYDYSFSEPRHPTEAEAVRWAIEQGVLCSDEAVLDPWPYASRSAWCAARCEYTEARLAEACARDPAPLVIAGHFPFRREHVDLPKYPAFSLWCGTERTRDWARRFRAAVVVYGHLHLPGTRIEEGVRYEEVSLGYPGQWKQPCGIDAHLRIVAE